MFYDNDYEKQILRSITHGNTSEMLLLIENNNISINKIDKSGKYTYLHFAYYTKQKNVFDILLENGAMADVDVKATDLFTLATEDKDPYYLETLLKYPNNFFDYTKTISGHYFDPIDIDREESLSRYELLYKKGADTERQRPNWPGTPLRAALLVCDYDRVLILLKYKAIFSDDDIHILNNPNPNMYSRKVSRSNREDVVEILNKNYGIEIELEDVTNKQTDEVITW